MTGAGPRVRTRRRWLARLAALPALLPLPAVAQTLGQGADDGISAWRIVLVLLLCLGLAVFAAFVLKRRMGGAALPSFFAGAGRNRRMQLVETLRLSHQIDLCIVSCDGREMLVAASAQGARLLQPLNGSASADERS